MKAILWDFDGTLARREGGWTAAVTNALGFILPDRAVTPDVVRPYLQTGFPWHCPETAHCHLRSADMWWDNLGDAVFSRMLVALGMPASELGDFMIKVRQVYCDTRHWHLYPDSLYVLSQLRAHDWSNRILSNHVPELSNIIDGVRLGGMFEQVYNSAETGFEKPNPGAFRLALDVLPATANVWMVGDSLAADVRGAEQVGLRAILARRTSSEATWNAEQLVEVLDIVAPGEY
jgi:putative hydrolase of the HAD superfamily